MPTPWPTPCAARLPWLDGRAARGRPAACRASAAATAGISSAAAAAWSIRLPLWPSRQRRPLSAAPRSTWPASRWASAVAACDPLLPVTEVVYSHCVSFGTADEIEFLATCRAELARRQLGGQPVAGRACRMKTAAGEVHGFALMLHGLKRAESVAIQESGLGSHRLLGCGLFIPHKSIAAVGE
jgi:hypothetical protein